MVKQAGFLAGALAALLSGCAASCAGALLLYVPFDGSAVPAVQSPAGAAAWVAMGGRGPDLAYVEGIRGQAAVVSADCRLPSAGNLRAESGTLALWFRPHWDGAAPVGHTLFCVYGHESIPEPWQHNRWSLVAGGGRLTADLYGARDGQRASLSADIAAWRAGEWHHVALTWHGVNSGRADAVVTLHLDGALVRRAEGLLLEAGPVGAVVDVGRDSDASPDYADADIDELYLYDEALPPETIARAVSLARHPEPEPPPEPPAAGAAPADWWHGAWRFRCAVTVPRTGGAGGEVRRVARIPLGLEADLSSLGVPAVPDPASYRLLLRDPESGRLPPGAAPQPVARDGDALLWPLPSDTPGAGPLSAWLYAGALSLDTTTPLWVTRRPVAWPVPSPEADLTSVADYAATAYGDAWDFDEGDLEAIDQWGDRPEFVRNREVRDGVLHLDVATDPWFVWGDMWGQVPRSQRPVAIDLTRFPVLRLRVRQSCAEARWDLYARVGTSPDLLHHEFRVTGNGWQTVRIDLVRDAGWGGVLTAFRIDPTSRVEAAHVEIDWVRLVNEVEARRGAPELLGPAGTPPPHRLELRAAAPGVEAGGRQNLVCRAVDAQGKPVGGWPITLRLESASDGSLASGDGPSLAEGPRVRRAITGEDGTATVVLAAGRRAGKGAEKVTAAAVGAAPEAALAIDVLVGPPHHYVVTPDTPLRTGPAELPQTVTAQVADAAGNPLPAPGRRVSFRAPPGAAVEPAAAETDARGQCRATTTTDPARRWVWRVEVEDSEGLRGASAPITFLPEPPRPNPIRVLPNGYFADAEGRPFVPLGGFYANWVQNETPDGEWRRLRSFTDTTDEEKRAWLRFLADSGVTALRFMLRTHRPDGMEPMDIGGRVNPDLFAEAVRYLDLGREFGIRFQLVVHEDYSKPVYVNRDPIERFALRHYTSEQLAALPPFQRRFLVERDILKPAGLRYTDPDAIACQDQYARELAQALRGNPQVFSYELENEMVNCPAAWASHAIEVLHAVDPGVLVGVSHGGGGLHTADPLWWHRNVRLDYYNYHLYPAGTTSAEMDYGAAVDVLARYGRMAGVCFLGESAGDEFSGHPGREQRRWVMRDIIWMALTNGNPGVFFWNARGAEVGEFRCAREAMGMLDLASFERAVPEIGISVDHPLADDKYYRTPQGAKDHAMMGRYAQHYLALGVDTDFVVGPQADAYPLRCTLAEFDPPVPRRRPFRPGPGWQLRYLARKDWGQVLVYIRNLAGIEPWRPPGDERARTLCLRTRSAAPLEVGLDLPAGPPYRAEVFDLDTGTRRSLRLEPGSALDLGSSDHDWAMVLRRP